MKIRSLMGALSIVSLLPLASTHAVADNTFIYALPGLPDTSDVGKYKGTPSRWIWYEIGGRYINYKTEGLRDKGCAQLGSPADVVGDVVASYNFSKDRKSISFKLKKGVLSPFGNELTTADVKWSMDRTLALDDTAKFFINQVTDYDLDSFITVVDKYNYRLNIENPTAIDLVVFTWPSWKPIDSVEAKKHASQDDPWAKKWLDNNGAYFGPWTYGPKDYQPGERLVLTPNPNYKGKRGNVDRLILSAVPDAGLRVQLMQTGKAHATTRLSYAQYAALKKSPGVRVRECVSASRDVLVLNWQDKRFSNMKVRRAVSLAIDREALIQGPYQGFGTPSKSGLSSGYDHDHASEYYTYNPERAKKLLAEAGYPNGFDFTLTYSPTRPGAHAEQVAILIADMLKKVGMRAKLNLIAGASEFEFTKKGPKESRGKARGYTSEMEAWIDFEGPAVVDPSYSMFLNNGCQSIWNNHGMCNEKYEDIMRKIKFLPSGPERRKLMSEAAVIVGEIQPWVYLIDIPYLRPETAKLKNWTAPANGELIVYRADLEK